MKYFTPELIVRGQSQDQEILDQVETLWDAAGEQYRNYYSTIEEQLPAGVQQMQSSYYLHDAEVLSIGRQGKSFVMVLRLETPPKDLLLFTCELAGEPVIDKEALPRQVCRRGRLEWLYEEVELLDTKPVSFLYSILLSNGWELQLPLSEIQVSQLQPVFPIPQSQPFLTPTLS